MQTLNECKAGLAYLWPLPVQMRQRELLKHSLQRELQIFWLEFCYVPFFNGVGLDIFYGGNIFRWICPFFKIVLYLYSPSSLRGI